MLKVLLVYYLAGAPLLTSQPMNHDQCMMRGILFLDTYQDIIAKSGGRFSHLKPDDVSFKCEAQLPQKAVLPPRRETWMNPTTSSGTTEAR